MHNLTTRPWTASTTWTTSSTQLCWTRSTARTTTCSPSSQRSLPGTAAASRRGPRQRAFNGANNEEEDEDDQDARNLSIFGIIASFLPDPFAAFEPAPEPAPDVKEAEAQRKRESARRGRERKKAAAEIGRLAPEAKELALAMVKRDTRKGALDESGLAATADAIRQRVRSPTAVGVVEQHLGLLANRHAYNGGAQRKAPCRW